VHNWCFQKKMLHTALLEIAIFFGVLANRSEVGWCPPAVPKLPVSGLSRYSMQWRASDLIIDQSTAPT
jgi:hypothetical protein